MLPLIEGSGYEYVGTEVKKASDAVELIVYIDSPNGIGLDECEKISRLIDPVIEAQDPIDGPYYLCISSPGLDRPLKSPRDFARSIGKKVDIRLFAAVEKQKEFTGVLLSHGDGGFAVEIAGAERKFAHADTAIVRLHVDF